jgi:hypothetical protein
MEGQGQYRTRCRGRSLAKSLSVLDCNEVVSRAQDLVRKANRAWSVIGLNRPGRADRFNCEYIFIDLSFRHNLAFSVH